jgi:hypothetical protein
LRQALSLHWNVGQIAKETGVESLVVAIAKVDLGLHAGASAVHRIPNCTNQTVVFVGHVFGAVGNRLDSTCPLTEEEPWFTKETALVGWVGLAAVVVERRQHAIADQRRSVVWGTGDALVQVVSVSDAVGNTLGIANTLLGVESDVANRTQGAVLVEDGAVVVLVVRIAVLADQLIAFVANGTRVLVDEELGTVGNALSTARVVWAKVKASGALVAVVEVLFENVAVGQLLGHALVGAEVVAFHTETAHAVVVVNEAVVIGCVVGEAHSVLQNEPIDAQVANVGVEPERDAVGHTLLLAIAQQVSVVAVDANLAKIAVLHVEHAVRQVDEEAGVADEEVSIGAQNTRPSVRIRDETVAGWVALLAHLVGQQVAKVAKQAHVGVVLVGVAIGNRLKRTQAVRVSEVATVANPAEVGVQHVHSAVDHALVETVASVEVRANRAHDALARVEVKLVAICRFGVERLAQPVWENEVVPAGWTSIGIALVGQTVGKALQLTHSLVIRVVIGLANIAFVQVGCVGGAEGHVLEETAAAFKVVPSRTRPAHESVFVEVSTVQSEVVLDTQPVVESQRRETPCAHVLVGFVLDTAADVLRHTVVVGKEEVVGTNIALVEVERCSFAVGNVLRDALEATQVEPSCAQSTNLLHIVEVQAVCARIVLEAESHVSSEAIQTDDAVVFVALVLHAVEHFLLLAIAHSVSVVSLMANVTNVHVENVEFAPGDQHSVTQSVRKKESNSTLGALAVDFINLITVCHDRNQIANTIRLSMSAIASLTTIEIQNMNRAIRHVLQLTTSIWVNEESKWTRYASVVYCVNLITVWNIRNDDANTVWFYESVVASLTSIEIQNMHWTIRHVLQLTTSIWVNEESKWTRYASVVYCVNLITVWNNRNQIANTIRLYESVVASLTEVEVQNMHWAIRNVLNLASALCDQVESKWTRYASVV